MLPKGDRVLVKVAEEETKTRGGILLPVSAVKKPTSGENQPLVYDVLTCMTIQFRPHHS